VNLADDIFILHWGSGICTLHHLKGIPFTKVIFTVWWFGLASWPMNRFEVGPNSV
jgi:hypothetical protein